MHRHIAHIHIFMMCGEIQVLLFLFYSVWLWV